MRKPMFLFLCLILLCALPIANAQETFTLTILHTNDTHSYHAPDNNGIGGVAKQSTITSHVRSEQDNVLLIDTGDRLTGTLFYTLYQGIDQIDVMNALGYDIVTLGNHEFDLGDEGLLELVAGWNFPVVVANADFSASILADAIKPYVILEVGGEQIGVIGLVRADTQFISQPSEAIIWRDDYANVVNEITEVLTKQGVNKILVISHLDIELDQALMPEYKGVDIVVGGDTHMLMSNVHEGATAAYPYRTENADGEPIVFVISRHYNQFIGRLDVVFDADGVIVSAEGDNIRLDETIEADPSIESLVDVLFSGVEEMTLTPIGAEALENLDGERVACRIENCTVGYLVADALRWETGAQVALVNGGSIRASIPAGEITLAQVLAAQPFNNTIVQFRIDGATLREALENGVSLIVLNEAGEVVRADASGRFLQFSGLRITYDPALEAGKRITEVLVDDGAGNYVPLASGSIYSVAAFDFILGGGDGYGMLTAKAINASDYGRVAYEVFSDYLRYLGAVTDPLPNEDGRITTLAPLTPRE